MGGSVEKGGKGVEGWRGSVKRGEYEKGGSLRRGRGAGVSE